MFTNKDMPQVPAAVSAGYFCSHAISVERLHDSPGQRIVKAWPAAV